MDNLKEKIEEVVNKVKNDPSFATKFQDDPVTALEEILDMDLPNDEINKMVDAVKAKINLENSGILDKIKGLFN